MQKSKQQVAKIVSLVKIAENLPTVSRPLKFDLKFKDIFPVHVAGLSCAGAMNFSRLHHENTPI